MRRRRVKMTDQVSNNISNRKNNDKCGSIFIADIFNSKQLYVMFAFENSGCALRAFTVNTIIYYITSRIFLYKFETWPPIPVLLLMAFLLPIISNYCNY